MPGFKFLLLAAIVAVCFFAIAPTAQAQVSVTIGPEPVCPYGYYDVPPYNCAPYGYYGPEWFVNGVFVGIGPWFHGPAHFHGYVDNHFHPDHGYHGAYPNRGERAEHPIDHAHFHGNEMRDEHGHVVGKH